MSANPRSSTWRAVRAALLVAGAQVAAAMALAVARTLELLDTETVMRGGMVVVGLGLAAIGNMMPKMIGGAPPQTLALAVLRQSVHRVGGWALTLAGLAFAGLWVFAPLNVAANGCVVAYGAAMAVMFGNYGWRIFAHRRSSAP